MKRSEGDPGKTIQQYTGQNRVDYYKTYAGSGGGCSRDTDGIQIDPDSYTSGIGCVFKGCLFRCGERLPDVSFCGVKII